MKLKDFEILFLNDKQIEELVPSKKVFELTETSLAEYAAGNAVNPVKLHLPIYPDYEGYINSMPAYLKRLKIAGAKIVSVYRDNIKLFKLPSTIGTVLLHNPESGMPYAIMNGTYITAARTGAVMGVMAKYTVRNNAKSLTIIGAGAQGFSAFIMISLAVPSIEEIRVVDIKAEAQDNFIAMAKAAFPDKTYVKYNSIQEACKNCDIILAAATSDKPLLANINFAKGSTVLIIEEDFGNTFIEKFDKFVGDFRECLIERINDDAKHHFELTGELVDELTEDSVTAEIGDIIIGKTKGRTSDDEIILAASVGMGIQDIIVGKEAYDRAVEQGIGIVIDFVGK